MKNYLSSVKRNYVLFSFLCKKSVQWMISTKDIEIEIGIRIGRIWNWFVEVGMYICWKLGCVWACLQERVFNGVMEKYTVKLNFEMNDIK